MDTHWSNELRFKPLLKLIFENCNNDDTCKYKIHQSEDNIDYISMKLSCISKFIERLSKIAKSNLDEGKQIQQIQRFKDHTHMPIFDMETSGKLLKLMKLFINPEQIKNKKKHDHFMKKNPVYNKCIHMMMNAPIHHEDHKHEHTHEHAHDHNGYLTVDERDHFIKHFYDVLSKEELSVMNDILKSRENASKYNEFTRVHNLQVGGAKEDKVTYDKISDVNNQFFKELFSRISTKIQEDKVYGTLDSIVDYKRRLEDFVRDSVQEMDVPEHLRYFVDNVNNLVDAIYPSNILDFVKSDDTIGAKIKNEFAQPFELVELVLFALSVIPIPVLNLIPDFMLIVHNLQSGKRIMFTILSCIALIIKISTLLFFDLGPIIKMYYLSKKIKNFNLTDLSQMLDKTMNDILTIPGGIAKFGRGVISKGMLPLASAGQLRPENMSLQLGNSSPISGSNPLAAIGGLGKLTPPGLSGSNPLEILGGLGKMTPSGLSGMKNTMDSLKEKKEEGKKEKTNEEIHKLEIETALLKGKINHREDVLEKYSKKDEYTKIWKTIDPNRENRIKAEVGDNSKILDSKMKILRSKTKGMVKTENNLIKQKEDELNDKLRELKKKNKTVICKAKESNSTHTSSFTKINVDCKGVPKRVAIKGDKLADDRLKGEYYKNKNKIEEINFQLAELTKLPLQTENPEKSEEQEEPKKSEEQEEPKKSEEQKTPEKSEKSEEQDEPKKSEKSEEQDEPKKSEEPDKPENPEKPEKPDKPENPEKPEK
jgi:hypothetical protein